MPGFVDLQVNGAFGVDVATEPECIGELSAKLVRTGTTSYLPTIVSLPLEEALALPEALPQREMFIAMTGGVVLATLLINATTIGKLVHLLGLDESSRAQRFLGSIARLSGLKAARERLTAGCDDIDLHTRCVTSG